MHIFGGLIVFTAVALLFFLILRSKGSIFDKSFDAYMEDDYKANQVIKISIDPSVFYEPPVDELPFRQFTDEEKEMYANLSAKQDVVLRKSKLKMIKFAAHKSNLEIKNEFGSNNLNNITTYEEHFNQYITALYQWAKALAETHEPEKHEDSKVILNSIACAGGETSKAYKLLSDLYAEDGQKEELRTLYEQVLKLNLPTQDSISAYISGKLNTIE